MLVVSLLVSNVATLVAVAFLLHVLREAHKSRSDLHFRYMTALQQLTQSSVERFELISRLEEKMKHERHDDSH